MSEFHPHYLTGPGGAPEGSVCPNREVLQEFLDIPRNEKAIARVACSGCTWSKEGGVMKGLCTAEATVLSPNPMPAPSYKFPAEVLTEMIPGFTLELEPPTEQTPLAEAA